MILKTSPKVDNQKIEKIRIQKLTEYKRKVDYGFLKKSVFLLFFNYLEILLLDLYQLINECLKNGLCYFYT